MSSFALYAVGFVVFLAGMIYGAVLIGIATQWIAVGAVALLGIGIMSAVSHTRRRDDSPAS